jgi:hypothetical protein
MTKIKNLILIAFKYRIKKSNRAAFGDTKPETFCCYKHQTFMKLKK